MIPSSEHTKVVASYPGPWEARGAAGAAAPLGNFHEPQKGLKFWRKGSNIDVRTGAVPFFFGLSERLVMYDRRLVPLYSVCGKLTKRSRKKFFVVNFDYV